MGNVDEESKRLVKTTRECLDKAIAACKPGALYRDMGNIISNHAHANGFSVVRSYCGHGVGELFHCLPNVPHYGKNKAVGMMKPGHVFTIEPMINMGTWHDTLWPDDWTAVTKDGRRSAQFEETLLITEDGVEVRRRWKGANGLVLTGLDWAGKGLDWCQVIHFRIGGKMVLELVYDSVQARSCLLRSSI